MEPQTNRQIDQAISGVEALYAAVTGHPAPPLEGNYSPIPPEAEPIRYLEEQMERLVELASTGSEQPAEWTPAASVRQQNDDLIIELEIAGVRRDAIHLSVAGNLLTVRGHREAGATVQSSERPFGRFHRTLALPGDARPSEMKASLHDGVLSIRMPRAPAARPLDITID
jgi:HSP20 family protein